MYHIEKKNRNPFKKIQAPQGVANPTPLTPAFNCKQDCISDLFVQKHDL